MDLVPNLRISIAAALVATALLRPAAADLVCSETDAQGVQECSAGLSAELSRRMYAEQSLSKWCWAASIAMVFARYGYPVEQEDVVERLYGALVDLPVRMADVEPLVNRDWFSINGRKVAALTEPVQLEGTVSEAATGAQTLIDRLVDLQPLLLGAHGHMVVVVGVRFQRFTEQRALRLTEVAVLDPAFGAGPNVKQWPISAVYSHFLVSVVVVPVSGDFSAARQINRWKAPDGARDPANERSGGAGCLVP
jgi:hypothetical protein